MPRVPTVNGPGVEQSALPGARQALSPEAGASAQLQASRLNEVSAAFQQWAREQQNKTDIDASWRAEVALKDDYLQFEQDELGKRGTDAQGSFERSQKWWAENAPKYAEGLTDRQQFAYARNVTALRQSSQDTLLRHERRQGDIALGESAQARVGSAINMAITDPTPERLANSRREIVEAMNIAGSLAGLPADAKAAKVQEALSLMHRGVVLQLADTDPDGAKAYYYGNKKEIGGGTQLELEKVVERSGRLQKAQTAADEIMARGMSLPDAMAHIEKSYSGDDEDAIKDEVRSRWATKKQGEAEIVTKAYGSALLAVAEGRKVPSDAWIQMDDSHRAAIRERQRADSKRRQSEAEGHEIKTDFATYDALNRMSWQRPGDFQSIDLGRYADKLSRADLRKFSEDQQKIGTAEGQKGLATRQQQISATIDQLKLGGQSKAEERGRLTQLINDGIETETARIGRPLKYDEVQHVIDKQVMQVAMPGRLWGTNETPAYEVKVPKTDREQIVDALTRAGRKVNEATILDLYLKKHQAK